MEQITKLREAIKGEALTEDVKSALSDLERELKNAETDKSKAEDLQNQLQQKEGELSIALRDTMKYKDIQKKATEQMKEMEAQIAETSPKLETLEALTAENESLKSLKVEKENDLRANYQKRVDEKKELPAFEKVKEFLTLPNDDLKIEDIGIGEIETSMKELDKAEKLGVFGAVDTRSNTTENQTDGMTGFEAGMNNAFGIKPKKE